MAIKDLSDFSSEDKASIVSNSREYKDLNLAFKLHPEFGDVRPVKDLNAIKNSIRNILLTRKGEKPFQPAFGCNLKPYLFEHADRFTEIAIEQEIKYSIDRFEPRVKLTDLIVEYNPDKNAYHITIEVTVVGSERRLDIELYLERLR